MSINLYNRALLAHSPRATTHIIFFFVNLMSHDCVEAVI